ncbi:MAG: hypothetical protein IJ180_05525 [Bacteroidales bacterium]|nr:hypothetical protein [Bacteroidales bacterium]
MSRWGGVNIQPYYIMLPDRDSAKYELRAINRITQMIRKNPQTSAILHDVKIVSADNIPQDAAVDAEMARLTKKYRLGGQYGYIARLANSMKQYLEVSLEASPRSKAHNTVNQELNLVQDSILFNGIDYGTYRYLSNKTTEGHPELVFRYIALPASIKGMTKLDEKEGFTKLGLEECYRATWFCHLPVFGMPCGRCNPCRDALNEGMSDRVPYLGRILGICRNQVVKCKNALAKT